MNPIIIDDRPVHSRKIWTALTIISVICIFIFPAAIVYEAEVISARAEGRRQGKCETLKHYMHIDLSGVPGCEKYAGKKNQ